MLAENQLYQKLGTGMEAQINIKIVSNQRQEIIDDKLAKAFLLFEELEKRLSRGKEGSEVHKLNTVNKGRFVEISELLFHLIKYSLSLAKKTEGAFDPTIGDLMEAHGYMKAGTRPNEVLLQALKKERSNYRNVHLWSEMRLIKLSPLAKLDFGGVVQGYSIDLAGKFLDEFDHFCIDLGGDILTKGLNKSGNPWKIGIRDPFDPEKFIKILQLTNKAVATSGGGNKALRIINPKTGDAPKDLASVTIIADNAIVADSYATAVLVMGKERGFEFLKKEKGVEGILVTSGKQVLETEGMKEISKF